MNSEYTEPDGDDVPTLVEKISYSNLREAVIVLIERLTLKAYISGYASGFITGSFAAAIIISCIL